MALSPAQQALVEDIVRLVSRGGDRPCTSWTPDTDPHERFRVTVCTTCHFSEAFHLLARSLEQIASARAEVEPWDPARAADIDRLFADLRQRITERAPLELIDSSLQAARVYAREPRPAGALEKTAAGILDHIVAAGKGVEDRALADAIAEGAKWLEQYRAETPGIVEALEP